MSGPGWPGVHIEDQRFPKRCGHLAGKYCLPVEEATLKLKAVLDARSDPDFFIIARTDAASAVGGGMADAIERSKRYADAGADMVWAEFPTPDRGDAEGFAFEIHRGFPEMPLAFNYSSSFDWTQVDNPLTSRSWATWATSSSSYPSVPCTRRCTPSGLFSRTRAKTRSRPS